MDLKQHIRDVPDFPKEGILFKDITTLLANPEAFNYCIDEFASHCRSKGITAIVGIESRGFMFGCALAHRLSIKFVPVRKPGKLPADRITETYELEYGTDSLEIHTDALTKDDKVAVVDDLLATGGTLGASCKLIERLGAEITTCLLVIELGFLKGREKLQGYDIHTLVNYE